MNNKIDLDKIQTDIINYLTKKEWWDHGYIKYSNIKKSITYITKIKKIYIIRKIFLSLVENDIFLKKQNKGVRSYLYKFKNPRETQIKKKSITITFH